MSLPSTKHVNTVREVSMAPPHMYTRQSEERCHQIRFCLSRHTKTSYKDENSSLASSTQAAGTAVPSQAVLRAKTLGLELTRNGTGPLRAAQTRNQLALVRVQLGEHGEHRWCAALTAVSAYSWVHTACPGPGCVGRARTWVRKTVPMATTRRERVDGGGGMAMMKQDGMCQSSSSRSRELSRAAVGATSARSGREQADIPQITPRNSGCFSICLHHGNSETSTVGKCLTAFSASFLC